MKAHAVLSSTIALGSFLTSMRLSRQANAKNEGSRKMSGDMTTLSGAVIRSAAEALKAHSSQPVILNLGPMLSLLMMLRSHRSRHHHTRWPGPSLPPGCVMVVRYMSH